MSLSLDPQTPLPPTAATIVGADQSLASVIIYGGNDNALSIARSLGARSISIHILNERRADVQYSRYTRSIALPREIPFASAAPEFLMSSASDYLRGSVLLAASDEALETIANHHETLARKYRLDLSNPVAQQKMLDKLESYKAARGASVPTPLFWQVISRHDVERLRDELVYPLIVKPRLSHVFQKLFKTKFIVAANFDELLVAFQLVESENVDVMLVEQIPGPDSNLCSYYTYMDENGHALFDFTKRILRRYPKNMGLACYHITDHVEQVAELSLKLFRHVGLQGLTNAEFKLDERDGQLKLIECNARFTAANGLVAKAGYDLSSFVYNRIVGLPQEPLGTFQDGLRLWDPLRDFQAYLELRRLGELTFIQWIATIMRWHTFPAFCWRDPLPSFIRFVKRFGKQRRSLKRMNNERARSISACGEAPCATETH